MFDWGAGMGVLGIWIGQLLAQALQTLAFLIYVFCFLDWNEEVAKAAMRQKLASNRPLPDYGCGETREITIAENSRSEDDQTKSLAKPEADAIPLIKDTDKEADGPTSSPSNILIDDETISSKEKSQPATLSTSSWEERENKSILKKLVAIFFFVILVLSLGITGNVLGRLAA